MLPDRREAEAPAAPGSRLRLLIVEDSPADARLLREALVDAGADAELEVVTTLGMAETRVRDERYDCVLLDLGLPDATDGLDNVHRIRAARRGQTVVIMTGLDSEEAALGTLQRGAQDYLVKGRYDGVFILRVIRRAIERNRVLNEIDQLREYQYYVATHDALTGLPNRQLFEDRAATAMAQAQREQAVVAIGYLDLDGFKPINDTHGHAVGDALLRAVGQALSETVRATDTVARTGGDEFLLLLGPLKENARQEAEATVARLRERLRAIREVDGRELRIGASIGLAYFPQQGATLDDLLVRADQEMYLAKRKARSERTRQGAMRENDLTLGLARSA